MYEYPDLPVVTAATYLGCWGDSKDDRIMGHVQSDNDMTNSVSTSLLGLVDILGDYGSGVHIFLPKRNAGTIEYRSLLS